MNLNCPDCHKAMIEVKNAELSKKDLEKFPSVSPVVGMYPKTTVVDGEVFHEYRFFCSGCNTEWTFDELEGVIMPLPKDSQFYYEATKKLLIRR